MFASLGAYGHLYPMMPLALACREAGHDVLVATGPPFVDRLSLPTVSGVAWTTTIDEWIAETRRRHPEAGAARRKSRRTGYLKRELATVLTVSGGSPGQRRSNLQSLPASPPTTIPAGATSDAAVIGLA